MKNVLYSYGIGHDNPKQAAVSVKDETSRKNTFQTRSILGEWCRSNPGVPCFTLSTHSPFFCALTSARKDNEKSSKQGGNNELPFNIDVPRQRGGNRTGATPRPGTIPDSPDLVLFPGIGARENQAQPVRGNHALARKEKEADRVFSVSRRSVAGGSVVRRFPRYGHGL